MQHQQASVHHKEHMLYKSLIFKSNINGLMLSLHIAIYRIIEALPNVYKWFRRSQLPPGD